jgi:hypothetical protein
VEDFGASILNSLEEDKFNLGKLPVVGYFHGIYVQNNCLIYEFINHLKN